MKNKPQMVDGFWWILHVENDAVDISSVEKYAQSNDFRPKDEKHVTIIGSKCRDAIVEKMDELGDEGKQKLLNSIETLMKKYDWKFEPKEYFHIKKEHEGAEKEAIICTISMPCLQPFYNDINTLLNADLPIQFPHISLFTKGPINKDGYYGIPMPSEEEFNKSNPVKCN